MPRRAKTINLLREVDLLQAHITPALCQTVFGAVRRTERQRMWTLEALIRFWTAVVLRAPKALTQALADSLEGRDPTYPRVEASPENLFSALSRSAAGVFADVVRRFAARLVTAVPPRYAAEVARVRARLAALVILDGSRLAAIAHRLKLLWGTIGRWCCRAACSGLRSGPWPVSAADLLGRCGGQRDDVRAKAAVATLARDTLVLGDRLYGTADFFAALSRPHAGAWSDAIAS